ncbi:hypothetical protein BCF55_1034 [Hydrogenivirga caldilitoris]|uniref:Uncharacterized protein n=1 Tax=Hydrogenivirga caldilitoris TaxID=246264 RepID=A0A497XR39_9AQUI|nr:hypothetical protein [Hydrogenivirga caldilitoris]RLJ70751.1 hypothetical protein BCF55_1034 [Hydrogenivirga caldilitoris]
MVLILLFALLTAAHGIELGDRCDIQYGRCIFDCVQEFPLDKKKRSGCETRCKINKGWCKTNKAMKDIANDISKFFQGFSKEK